MKRAVERAARLLNTVERTDKVFSAKQYFRAVNKAIDILEIALQEDDGCNVKNQKHVITTHHVSNKKHVWVMWMWTKFKQSIMRKCSK